MVNAGLCFRAVPIALLSARASIRGRRRGATPPTLVAGWYPQEIVFAARGSGPFELAYGSRRVAPGALSIGNARARLCAGKPLPATSARRGAAAPSAVNRQRMREPLDAKRLLLWGSLVLASLLLGYMALRLARQMRSGSDRRLRGSVASAML